MMSDEGRCGAISCFLAKISSNCCDFPTQLFQSARFDNSALSSLSLISLPSAKFTPIISPGPSLPNSWISEGGIETIPVSEPARRSPPFVIVYLNGRKPFLSIPPITQFPEKAAIAAGPSHGSITALQ